MIPPRTAPRRRTLACAAVAALALALGAPSQGAAETPPEVQDLVDVALGSLGDAAIELLHDDRRAAQDAMTVAAQDVQTVVDAVAAPETVLALGKGARAVQRKVRGFQRKTEKAQQSVDDFNQLNGRALKKVARANRAGAKVANVLRRLGVLTLQAIRSSGFHRPDDLVTFRIRMPEGCEIAPAVSVSNAGADTAVDPATVIPLERGRFRIRMDAEVGGGYVTLDGCGQRRTVMIFNKGPKPVKGGSPGGTFPGFPNNLPKAKWDVTYTQTVEDTDGGFAFLPETPLLTFPKVTGNQLRKRLDAAIFVIQEPVFTDPGCQLEVTYSAFNGGSFTATYVATCVAGDVTVTDTLVATLRLF